VEHSFQYFVGIDWGTQTHRVAVLDASGRAIEQYNADHSGEGLVTLVNKLKQRTACEPALVAIGIEVAWGALVETLVESGFTLFSINPKQVDRFRDASLLPEQKTTPGMLWYWPARCLQTGRATGG
jgi:predicted NBD/HSP70 family sugar kinase